MASLRSLAACIEIRGEFRVVRDFFGCRSAPPWSTVPDDPKESIPRSLSLLTQMKRLQQPHFNLNIIRVGTDSNGSLRLVDEQNVDCAVERARAIFADAGIGIGRVVRSWRISAADTDYETIDSEGEAIDLVEQYSVGGSGIDVFFVLAIVANFAGAYPAKGDGIVVELLEKDFSYTGVALAHELGHYFGLGHKNQRPENLMCQGSEVGQLDDRQIEKIKKHEKVFDACESA